MFVKYSTMLGAALLTVSQTAGAVTINFDYSYDGGFFSGANSGRRTTLEAAGGYLGSILNDSLAPIDSTANLRFDINFRNPGSVTQDLITISNYDVAADALTVFVGGSALGGSTLGFGGPGGYGYDVSGPGGAVFINTIERRDQSGYTTDDPSKGQVATDFAPWGGQITFSSDAAWDFDLDPSNITGNDFYSVALHELLHVLGYGQAQSWINKVSGNNFTGANAVAAYGGNVPLDDTAHWRDGTMSTVSGTPQETAMDPIIRTGTRKLLTELDLAGLKDIGWEVSAPTAVPVPAAAWLFGSAILGFVGFRRRKA